jgi:hypothetical protein
MTYCDWLRCVLRQPADVIIGRAIWEASDTCSDQDGVGSLAAFIVKALGAVRESPAILSTGDNQNPAT